MMQRRLWTYLLALCLASAIVPVTSNGQATHREILRAKFTRDLQRVADNYSGVLGVASVDLRTKISRCSW
jgi:hypothetical protein